MSLRDRFFADHAHIPDFVADFEDPRHYSDNSRIKALADGVFAIAMTLLAFSLLTDVDKAGDLGTFLDRYQVLLLVYVMSFVVLGSYWVANAILFHYIVRSDRPLMVRTIIFLLFVSLVPFSAYYLGYHVRADGITSLPVAVYAANLIACGFGAFGILLHATRDPLMLHEVYDKRIYRGTRAAILVGPAIYAVALALSFVVPVVAFALLVIVPIVTFFPNPFWGRVYARAVQLREKRR